MNTLLPCVLLLILWDQVVAPVSNPCSTLNDVRFNNFHPQLCTQNSEMLEWNYFCDNIGMKEGRVFCRLLGYPGYDSKQTSKSGDGINDLDCNGDETLLTQCSYDMALTTCQFVEIICNECTKDSMCGAGLCANRTCVCNDVCEYGGYCFLGNCICPEGLGGPGCRDCDPPCQNGGVCSAGGNCQCVGSFSGAVCELNSTVTTDNTTATTVQPINNTTVVTDVPLSLTLVIAVVIPSLICSCTLIIICFGILVFLAFIVIRMKPVLNEKVDLTTHRNSETSNPSSIRKPPYDLEVNSSTHDYCYIQETVIPNNIFAMNQSSSGVYEVVTLEDFSKDHFGVNKVDTTASDVSKERKNPHYEIDNVDDVY